MRLLQRILLSTTLTLGVLSSGCAAPPVSLSEGPRSYVADDYKSVLRRWTREIRLHSLDEMDNVLTVTSTYQSWDFRWAYVTRYARDYRLTDAETEAMLSRSLDTSKEFHEFYVALYAQDPDYAELHEDEPVWIVRLIDDSGTETKPAHVEKIKDPGALEQSYYPYTSSFRTVYRLSFPKKGKKATPVSANAKWFGLRFSGVHGDKTVRWELQ